MAFKIYTYLCVLAFLFVLSTGAMAQETLGEQGDTVAAESSSEAVAEAPVQPDAEEASEEAVESVPPAVTEEEAVEVESEPEGEHVPFNIGLFPYANINAYKYKPHNNFSLDIFVGMAESLTGFALAVGASVVNENVHGVQWGLVTSVAKKEVRGVQLGLVNVAGDVTKKSVQIGLINYSDTVGNASVGLINIHKKGKHTLDVWTTDFAIFNVGTKLGGDYVYSILGFCFQPKLHPDNPEDSVFWGPIIGLGGKIPIKNGGFLALEWVIHLMFDDTPQLGEGRPVEDWAVATVPNVIQQLRLVGGYEINDMVTVFAGPALTINQGAVEIWGISYLPKGATFMEFDGSPGQMAIGFAAGVELF
jgi:hypothetical protein